MNHFKFLIIILIISFNSKLFAQETQSISYKNPQQAIALHIQFLENAMVQKDTKKLDKILHEDLTFGHSNGWMETKESLLHNLPTSKVSYTDFIKENEAEIKIISEVNPIATVRREITAIGEYEETAFEVDLKVLEIWIKKDEIWQLLARQSVEVDFDE